MDFMEYKPVVTTKTDLSRVISDWVEGYECVYHGYNSHDEFVSDLSDEVLDVIRVHHGFNWGDSLPEITDNEFRDCVDAISYYENSQGE